MTTPNDQPSTTSDTATEGRPIRTGVPMGSSFNDLFSGGASVWMKILGAAIAVPVAVLVFGRKAARGNSSPPFSDPGTIAMVLAGCSLLGAFLGGALSMKDVVDRRKAESKPVAFPLRLLFGYGFFSILPWIPFGIVVLIVVMTMFG